MFEITFCFENGERPITAQCAPNETILETARRVSVAIDAPCSGNGSCGKCLVRLLSGQAESHQASHLSDAEFADGWRLACCTKPLSDLEVLVPDCVSAYRTSIRTAELSERERQSFSALLCIKDNGFEAHELTVSEPTSSDTLPDNERLAHAVEAQLGCKAELSLFALKKLPLLLREENFNLCVLGKRTEDRFFILDLAPIGIQKPMCGIAADIGTTTVCVVLFDLLSGEILAGAACGNGQIRYGADVINRIIEQGKPHGISRLQDAVINETLHPLIEAVCKNAGIAQSSVFRMSVAANTTMNHLLLGIYADPVRTEPYIPAFFRSGGLCARDLGLKIHPNAELLLAPNIGSYVGGDITAGTFASRLCETDALSLFIDLGTNGEIVFGNREFTVACACSAGPAFEGGDISCGMRATDGAIDACTIDPCTLEPTFSVIGGGKPVGICGSGIIDIIAKLFDCGIINAKGHFIREGSRIAYDRYGTGRYILSAPNESATGREISINSVDIDNFIRAKGAVYSAIDTLLSAMDMDESLIETVYVAGGIGSGINIENAVRIGMLPNLPAERFRYIGNSSLMGAYAMAFSDEAAARIDEIAQSMTYMELSSHAGYMDRFVAACFLPHTDAERFRR